MEGTIPNEIFALWTGVKTFSGFTFLPFFPFPVFFCPCSDPVVGVAVFYPHIPSTGG
jgi:hypothetical protein